jgi:hypothetical protein
MKKILLISGLIITLSALSQTTYYINNVAIGKNDGSNWTNAWRVLPDKLEIGAVYYVADGNYSNSPAITTNSIIIKKATSISHGTAAGWKTSYGDGSTTLSVNGWVINEVTSKKAPITQKVQFAWDLSPDLDVIGYKVYIGNESGIYTNYLNPITISNTNTVVVPLTGFSTYFITVRAYDSFGLESVPSNEVMYQIMAQFQ